MIGGSPDSARRDIGVVTVDDQPLFRRVASELVAATPGFVLLGEAASGVDALAVVADVEPDLVLVDVGMPGMGGAETARRLSAAHPELVVVLVTADDPDDIGPVEGSGAVALLRKQDLCLGTLNRLWLAHGPTGRRD